MDQFTESLTKWQPFFTTIAGVAATLAGLLFVALSLNRDRVMAPGNDLLLRLARRSFGDLLYALFISLMFLMPGIHCYALAMPLLGFSTVRGVWLVHHIVRSSKDGITLVRDFAFQTVTCLGLLGVAIEISRGSLLAIYILVPLVSFLLYNASLNAWTLLLMEKAAEVKLTCVPESRPPTVAPHSAP